MIKEQGKKIYMVTNAHYKVLDIKLKKTEIGTFFDRCITSFELGYPKEKIEFWQKLERMIHFNKDKTLFIDDSEDILITAKAYGIKYLLLKTKANSRKGGKSSTKFPKLRDFKELMTNSSTAKGYGFLTT